MNVIADRADRSPGASGRREERERLRWRPWRTIGIVDAMPAARRAYMLTQELSGVRIEQPDVEIIPLHVDATADPAWWRAVVRRVDFDAAIEVHGADTEAVIPKRFERQRSERRSFLGKHRGNLALGGAVNPRIGPVRLPAIEISLRGLERFEAQAVQ